MRFETGQLSRYLALPLLSFPFCCLSRANHCWHILEDRFLTPTRRFTPCYPAISSQVQCAMFRIKSQTKITAYNALLGGSRFLCFRKNWASRRA